MTLGRAWDIRKQVGESSSSQSDVLVIEEPLELRIEGQAVAVVMRTPGHDHDLALGFLCTEGVIDGADDIQAMAHVHDLQSQEDNVLDCILSSGMGAERKALANRTLFASSSCGICGKESIERIRVRARPLSTHPQLSVAVVQQAPEQLRKRQPIFAATGGIHGALLMDRSGAVRLCREDVGRHNAVDKVIGAALKQELELEQLVMVISGRAGFEIAQKCIVAGIPALIAVGAPSSLAVELATETGLELIAFARGESFNRYTD